ncbi:hypothetical protein CRUP_017599 [Coryphaenoides rupestris]|nr:hypothetical protein CRUP_017599 [Coryphaenoides rupestris]
MHGTWLQTVSLLGALGVLLVLSEVSGVEIYTTEHMEVANGTDVRLKCTFSSTHTISPKTVTVSWNFRSLDQGREESLLHYQEVAYPPTSGPFKDRVVWSGDVSNRDASITLQGVVPTFNGTYSCQVRNPPDVHGQNGEIVLKVVNKVSLSEMALLAAIAGGVCAVILLLVVVYVLVRRRRRWHEDGDMELPERRKEKEWKDPTVCSPEEAIHLTMVEKVLEVESSDDASEPSSGDDDEEEEEEEDDDDDDDDGGGGDDDD